MGDMKGFMGPEGPFAIARMAMAKVSVWAVYRRKAI
jgi:hypothetical protein